MFFMDSDPGSTDRYADVYYDELRMSAGHDALAFWDFRQDLQDLQDFQKMCLRAFGPASLIIQLRCACAFPNACIALFHHFIVFKHMHIKLPGINRFKHVLGYARKPSGPPKSLRLLLWVHPCLSAS
jgi:hypothetical protein